MSWRTAIQQLSFPYFPYEGSENELFQPEKLNFLYGSLRSATAALVLLRICFFAIVSVLADVIFH